MAGHLGSGTPLIPAVGQQPLSAFPLPGTNPLEGREEGGVTRIHTQWKQKGPKPGRECRPLDSYWQQKSQDVVDSQGVPGWALVISFRSDADIRGPRATGGSLGRSFGAYRTAVQCEVGFSVTSGESLGFLRSSSPHL